MARRTVDTIGDLERVYYGETRPPEFYASTSSVAGVLNPIYTDGLWAQLNQEANSFGVLPRVSWPQSGEAVPQKIKEPEEEKEVLLEL